jgi:S1-C subfamily serine protease
MSGSTVRIGLLFGQVTPEPSGGSTATPTIGKSRCGFGPGSGPTGLSVLFASTLNPQAKSIPQIVKESKPAIVEIVTVDDQGKPKMFGTGFFVSPDGLVVSNFHVIEGASSITAINNNGAVFFFDRIVAHPTGVDLAVLKFQAHDVPLLPLGKSIDRTEGEKVIVIGNPTGLTGTVSDGIISAFREEHSLIQITAPTPGSSGSPVLDEDGKVIGIATVQIQAGQNLNFAIAVEKVTDTLSSIAQATPSPHALLPDENKSRSEAIFNRGNEYLRRGKLGEALSAFNEAIRINPAYAEAFNGRGKVYLDRQTLDEWLSGEARDKAISDYNEAIRLNPNYAEAYVNRGYAYGVYSGGHDRDAAISDYSKAIRLDPNCTFACYYRGLEYAAKGNYDKAISDYTEAIRLDPNFADAYRDRGSAYGIRGKLDKAKADYDTENRLKAGQ